MTTDFKHISDRLSNEEIEKLSRMYGYYQELTTFYKKKHKHFGNVVNRSYNCWKHCGWCYYEPNIVLGCLAGSGVLIQEYISKSTISKRIEGCKIAYQSFDKKIIQLRSYLRGLPYDIDALLSEAVWTENLVSDLCPPKYGL